MGKRKKPTAEASEDETSAKGLLPRKRRKLSPGSGYEGPEVSLSDFSLEASYGEIPFSSTGHIDDGDPCGGSAGGDFAGGDSAGGGSAGRVAAVGVATSGVVTGVDTSFDSSHKRDRMRILTDTSGEGASCDKSPDHHSPEIIRGPCSSVSVSNNNTLSPIASKSRVSFTVSPNQSSSSNSFTFYPRAPTASTPGTTLASCLVYSHHF